MRESTWPHLTAAQRGILERLVLGRSDQQIGAALGLTTKAVSDHLVRIYRTLALADAGNRRVAAAVWYARHRGASRPQHHTERPCLGAAEWRVLERLARGESNRQIARALALMDQTVKNHLGRIYRRLPLGEAGNQRVAAAVWYDRVGRAQHEQEAG